MVQHLNMADGDGPAWELYPSLVAVGSIYGSDHYNGTYARFLAKADDTYPNKPYFLFNQVRNLVSKMQQWVNHVAW